MNRPWGWVGEGCSKTSKGEQRGRGGSKIGNLEQTYFLNVPKVIRSEECVTQHKLWKMENQGSNSVKIMRLL